MRKRIGPKTRGSVESTTTLAPLAAILCDTIQKNEKPTTLVVWRVGKESPAGCACLQLLQQPPRSSLIDEHRTAQIRTPPVPTQFPFLYSNLRLEYSSSIDAFLKVAEDHNRAGRRFWGLLNHECLPALEAVRRNCPTREEFRTVESISSDCNITAHQSTLRILTSTLPYNEIILQ